MRRFSCVLLDVFTSRPLQGNQLAVFTDARDLQEYEFQLLAKETNLSETTFIFPRDKAIEREHGVKVRIFTVDEELPFAGHPVLGTASVIRGDSGAERVMLDVPAGQIPVSFELKDGKPFGEMRQRDPEFGQLHPREEVVRVTNLSLADIRDDVPIQTASTGVAFAIVPVKSLAAMQKLKLDWSAAAEYLKKTDAKFLFFVSQETVDPAASLHARMIFYNGEDPATGSASGCCAAWAVKHGVMASDTRVMIEQGLEINRPSEIYIAAKRSVDKVSDVRVGGHVVEVARAEFTLP